MPDWISHLLVALIIAELFRLRPKSLVILGALASDFVSKIVYLRMFFPWFPNLIPATSISHTFVGAIFISMLMAYFFRLSWKKSVLLMSIGGISHVLLDLTCRYYLNGYTLFFPFSWEKYSLGMVWTEKYYIYIIITAVLYLAVKMTMSKKK